MPDIKLLSAETSISKASILNNHIASYMTQLQAKQLDKESGCPTHEVSLLESPVS